MGDVDDDVDCGPRTRSFTETDLWRLVHRAASALTHLHARSVLHMDVKPANIFITNEGEFKIGDLNSAVSLPKKDARASSSLSASATGSILSSSSSLSDYEGSLHRQLSSSRHHSNSEDYLYGSGGAGMACDTDDQDLLPSFEAEGDGRYMAPEVLAYTASPAADMYSFGLSLYQIATGIVVRSSLYGSRWDRLRNGSAEERARLLDDDCRTGWALRQAAARADGLAMHAVGQQGGDNTHLITTALAPAPATAPARASGSATAPAPAPVPAAAASKDTASRGLAVNVEGSGGLGLPSPSCITSPSDDDNGMRDSMNSEASSLELLPRMELHNQEGRKERAGTTIGNGHVGDTSANYKNMTNDSHNNSDSSSHGVNLTVSASHVPPSIRALILTLIDIDMTSRPSARTVLALATHHLSLLEPNVCPFSSASLSPPSLSENTTTVSNTIINASSSSPASRTFVMTLASLRNARMLSLGHPATGHLNSSGYDASALTQMGFRFAPPPSVNVNASANTVMPAAAAKGGGAAGEEGGAGGRVPWTEDVDDNIEGDIDGSATMNALRLAHLQRHNSYFNLSQEGEGEAVMDSQASAASTATPAAVSAIASVPLFDDVEIEVDSSLPSAKTMMMIASSAAATAPATATAVGRGGTNRLQFNDQQPAEQFTFLGSSWVPSSSQLVTRRVGANTTNTSNNIKHININNNNNSNNEHQYGRKVSATSSFLVTDHKRGH